MDSQKKRWAILIGVDTQDPNLPSSEPKNGLRGAATDVHAISKYLETEPVDLTELVSVNPKNNVDAARMVGNTMPTRDNVIKAMKRVIDLGQPDDSVYIHFSGHGTCIPRHIKLEEPLAPWSQTMPGVLALVLYDRYLEGEILQRALERMEQCKMLVTLVLDCCFSGSMMRTGALTTSSAIRFMSYDPAVDAAGTADAASQHQDPFFFEDTGLRQANLKSNPMNILDPEKHSILTACGPHQIAREIEFADGTRQGALSYFLLDALKTLRQSSSCISRTSLLQYLCALFHANHPEQAPVWYGNGSHSFFEQLGVVSAPPLVYMLWSKEGQLMLDAGAAQGVHVGDEYEVLPYYATEEESRPLAACAVSKDMPPVRVAVKSVKATLSEIRIPTAFENKSLKKHSVWKARCIASHAPDKIRIGIMPAVLEQLHQEALATAAKSSFLDICTDQENSAEHVLKIAMTDSNTFQIQDAVGRLILDLPTMDLDRASSVRTAAFVDMLGHLATFKYFERMRNETPDNAFEKELAFNSNCTVLPDGRFEVKHDGEWTCTFRNLGASTKYVNVFNLTPSWQIKNLTVDCGEGNSIAVQGNSEYCIRLRMTVPADIQNRRPAAGSCSAEDVVKLIITNNLTTFPCMILPPLEAGNVRGEPVSSMLAQLLQALDHGWRGAETRWSCRTLVIKTQM